MRYPLKDWKTLPRGYKFGSPTSYSSFHLGTDVICKTGTQVLAPVPGIATGLVGTQGGITIHLKTPTNTIRFLHLSKVLKTGQVQEGDIIGLTGNTGSVTTGPHLHADISKGAFDINNFKNFLDPEIYFKPTNPMNYKLAIINLDFSDPELVDFPSALKAEVSRLSGGKFPIEVTMIDFPRTDVLQNIPPRPTPTSATYPKLEYLRKVVDESGVTGYRTVAIIYHITPKQEVELGVRPTAHGSYNGQQIIQSWFWNKVDLPSEPSMIPGWNWAIIHELCHSIFFKLNELGISERDTTHDNIQADFSDEFQTFIKYPQLTGGVTPPKVMTEKEVRALQALEGYSDPSGVLYWSGKPLQEYLTARLNDKVKNIQAAQQ